MSLLAHLNLNYLRIFLTVYRTKSMTQAAKQLHLTHSGVSQQIKALEEALDITLFDRINRRIIPTSEAEILYSECSKHLDDWKVRYQRYLVKITSLQARSRLAGVSISLVKLIGQVARFQKKPSGKSYL